MAQGTGIEGGVTRGELFEGALVDGHFQCAFEHVDELLAGMTVFVYVTCAGLKYEEHRLDPPLHVANKQIGRNPLAESAQRWSFALPDDLNEAAALFIRQQIRHAQFEHTREFLKSGGRYVRLAVLEHRQERARHACQAGNICKGVLARKPDCPQSLTQMRGAHGAL